MRDNCSINGSFQNSPASLEPLETRMLFSADPLTLLPELSVPPASTVVVEQDAYEDNDRIETAFGLATPVGVLSEVAGLATATDNDWYRVQAGAGLFQAQLSSFSADGELNIEVYTGDGSYLGGNYRSEDQSTVQLELAEDSELVIFVYAAGPFQGNAYDLAWSGTTPGSSEAPADPEVPAGLIPGTPDAFENNDSQSLATILATSAGALSATATENDWYRVQVGAGPFRVDLSSVPTEGELNVEIYTGDGAYVTGSYGSEAQSTVELDVAQDSEFLIFIYAVGPFQGNVYDLAWSGVTPGAGEAPVEPEVPVDPEEPVAPEVPTGSEDAPVLDPVLHPAIAQWAQAATTGRADILVLGDSVVFNNGTGWDGGLNAGFDRTLGLAGTGLLSGNFAAGTDAGYGYEAFGQNASNWRFDFIPGTDVDAITNDEISSDFFARVQHPWGQLTVNPIRGSVAELGVQLNGNGDTAEPDQAFTFQTWVSGDGATFNVTRTAEDGSVDVVGLQEVNGEGTQVFTFDFPAGESPADAAASIAITDPSQLTFVPAGSNRSLNETPLTVSNFRLLETESTGATVTSWGYGGESTREFFAEQYEPVGQENRAEILDRIVDGGSGKLLVFVMEGLNDRSEDQPSLNGIADPDSPEAFIDNVSTLIDGVRSDWAAAGNDASDLHFVTFGTYDQGSDPQLESFSAALQQQATETDDVSFIDLRTLSGGLTLDQMVELGFIQGADSTGGGDDDFIHLTESGSVFYGEAIATLIAGTATQADAGALANVSLSNALGGVNLGEGIDAANAVIVDGVGQAANTQLTFALPNAEADTSGAVEFDLTWANGTAS